MNFGKCGLCNCYDCQCRKIPLSEAIRKLSNLKKDIDATEKYSSSIIVAYGGKRIDEFFCDVLRIPYPPEDVTDEDKKLARLEIQKLLIQDSEELSNWHEKYYSYRSIFSEIKKKYPRWLIAEILAQESAKESDKRKLEGFREAMKPLTDYAKECAEKEREKK